MTSFQNSHPKILCYLIPLRTVLLIFPLKQKYLLELLVPLYQSVGFADNVNDPHLSQYKRVRALRWACDLDYEDCIQNSVSLFNQWMQNPANKR